MGVVGVMVNYVMWFDVWCDNVWSVMVCGYM